MQTTHQGGLGVRSPKKVGLFWASGYVISNFQPL